MKDSDVAEFVASLKDNAERLGLIWTRRFGTVVAINPSQRTYAAVQMDSPTDDAVAIDCVSMCGQLTVGSRVLVDSVPPAGKFVSGVVKDNRPGQKLVKVLYAAGSGAVTLSTSAQDVPGVSVTYSSLVTHTYTAWGTFDFNVTATGAANAQGVLDANGVGGVAQAILGGGSVTRATVAQSWTDTIAAGSKTFKLRALKSAALATISANANSSLLVHIYEPL